MTRRCTALRPLRGMLVLLLAAAVFGCGQKLVFPRLDFKSDETRTPSIPLAVRLDIPDALKKSQLFYKDSCGQSQSIPVGERLAEQLKADAAGIFEKTFEGGPKDAADAVMSAAMEASEINLYIPRREIGEYKMTSLVRLRITVVDAEGKSLFNETIKGEGKWTVTTDGIECTVRGLMLPVTEALEKVSDREVEALNQSVKIRDWAIRLTTRREMAAAAGRQSNVPSAAPSAADPPTLSFRATLEDENRNQMLDTGEKVVVRVEVANSGPGIARGVTVVLSGTPDLIKEFTNPTMLGDLQPGEKKQAVITSILPASLSEQEAELFVQVTEGGGFGPSVKKRFAAMIRQGASGTSATAAPEAIPPPPVSAVDVDQIPPRALGFDRRTSFAIVVGIGGYRDPGVSGLKYARQDAEMVAKHLTALGGFSAENVRLLTDDRALLSDLQDAFEDWLPRRASSTGIVVIYLVGTGTFNADEPILIPYDGRPESAQRGYSLKRLQDVLGRLPSRLNLVFADLSFAGAGNNGRSVQWNAPRPGDKGRTVIVGSTSAAIPTLSFEPGRHGLFTYHFLKAIRGQADANNNGWVDVGEIAAYLRSQVGKGAAEQKKEQLPVVVPAIDAEGPIGTFPVTKARR